MDSKAYKIQDSITNQKKSKLKRYQELVVGTESLLYLIKYELIVLFISWIPGALGIFLRSKLYSIILGKVGSSVVFGTNIVLRHPQKINMGDNVIIDDNVMIDAKGSGNDGITLRNDVFIGRNSILSCKDGNIELDERANIGFNCEVFSSNNVKIGKDNIIAAYTYIVGGGNYKLDRTDIPINRQYDFKGKGGVTLGDDVWIGAHCVILDGVHIDNGTAIAAGAIVTKDVPGLCVAAGIPAKVILNRAKS
ncbi:acyltransferase [candidate division KSB1 bacterium]|nr:acyltransferase [candidate division KSB1 bacterium]